MAFVPQQDEQIPQALQQLTSFLQKDTADQLAQNQSDQVNKSIADASQRFKSLGPDATEADARGVFFDALSTAAQNKVGPQVAPLLQNLYNEADRYIQVQKTQNQDNAYIANTANLYGIPSTMAAGMGAQGLSNFVTQGQNEARQQKITNPDGSTSLQSTLTKYDTKTGSFGYQPVGDPIVVDKTTYATGAAQKLAEHEATRQYDIAHPLHDTGNTTIMTSGNGYMGTIGDGKGGTVQVPLQGIKGKPGYWYFANGQMNQYDPLAQGSPSKYVDPTVEAGRQQRLAGTSVADQFKNSQAAGKGLINLLVGNHVLPRGEFFNSNGQQLPGATAALDSRIASKSVWPAIKGIKDPNTKEALLNAYGQYQVSKNPQEYTNAYNRVKAAFDTGNSEKWAIQQMVAGFKGATTPDEAHKMTWEDYDQLNEGYKANIAQKLNLKK